MDCNIQSKPHQFNYWRRHDDRIFRPQQFPDVTINAGDIFTSNKKTSRKRHQRQNAVSIVSHHLHHHPHPLPQNSTMTTKGRNFNVLGDILASGRKKMARTRRKEADDDVSRHSVEIFEYMSPEEVPTSDTIVLSLRIESLRIQDYGSYWCVAENDHGTAKEEMHLLGYFAIYFYYGFLIRRHLNYAIKLNAKGLRF